MVDYWASEEMDIYCDGSSMGRAPMLCAYDKSLLLDCFLVLLTVILAFILLTMFRVIRCGFTSTSSHILIAFVVIGLMNPCPTMPNVLVSS